jgi:RES domain-containing protein
VLYRYHLDLQRVLDLTNAETREHAGVTKQDVVADDWTLCQAIGAESHDSGDQAIRTFSATGVDRVLVVFPESIGRGLTHLELVERWDTVADIERDN